MLVVDNVSKRFAGVAAVAGASLKVQQLESVGLVGPNGSGKSTLLNLITGFEKPDGGVVTLNGVPISGRQPWDIAGHGLRRTFQRAEQPTRLSVMELMLLGGNLKAGETVRANIFTPRRVRTEEREAIDRARALLTRLQLDQLADHPGGKLSGGQQKLLALGMVLMSQPQVVLLDEPTAGVNPALRVRLAEHLRQLQSEGLTILVVEHDMRFVADTCDRVYVLDKGTVLTTCAPSELASNPEVLEAYLGKAGRMLPSLANNPKEASDQ